MLRYMQAVPGDAQAIFKLSRENISSYDPAFATRSSMLRQVRESIEEHIGEYRVILYGEMPAGYFWLRRNEQGCELNDFYLFQHFRGKGIGSRVLEEITAWADRENHVLLLYVYLRNAGALKLYRRFGFVLTELLRGALYQLLRNPRVEKPE